jgi:hypothetical protein
MTISERRGRGTGEWRDDSGIDQRVLAKRSERMSERSAVEVFREGGEVCLRR